jgi:hypothetical protein
LWDSFYKVTLKLFILYNKKVINTKYDTINCFKIKQALSEGKLTNVNLTTYMSPWTKQKGYPVITIRRIGNNQIGITQNRFVLDIFSDISELKKYLLYFYDFINF